MGVALIAAALCLAVIVTLRAIGVSNTIAFVSGIAIIVLGGAGVIIAHVWYFDYVDAGIIYWPEEKQALFIPAGYIWIRPDRVVFLERTISTIHLHLDISHPHSSRAVQIEFERGVTPQAVALSYKLEQEHGGTPGWIEALKTRLDLGATLAAWNESVARIGLEGTRRQIDDRVSADIRALTNGAIQRVSITPLPLDVQVQLYPK